MIENTAGPDANPSAEKPTPELVGIFRRMVVLSRGYWTEPGAGTAWALTGGMFALALAQIGIQIWLNFWNREFFNALEAKDWAAFYRQILFFCAIVVASVTCVAIHLHVKRRLQRHWREWLSQRTVGRWLEGGRHYQLQFLPGDHDNPDGRIAEDIRIVTEYAVEFANSIFYCVLLLVSFLGILWTLSGILPVTLGGTTFNVHGYMVWVAIAYAILGTTVTIALGRPLVAWTDERQGREADFRFSLVRAREHGEAIALLRGEADERRRLLGAFHAIVGAWDKQTIGQRRLMMLTNGYATLAVAVPLLVAAPRYFAGAIALGGLMQTAQAFVQVQSAMSWFVDNFPRFAEWSASAERVLNLHEALDNLDEEHRETATQGIAMRPPGADPAILALRDLSIVHPDGTVMIRGVEAEIRPGEWVLIKGESGSGKSTLLRAIAGLWPWGGGGIELPAGGRMVFMPQRPYLPVGTLRTTLLYPDAQGSDGRPATTDADMCEALRAVGLEQLCDRLDDQDQWDKTLSGGEQQRLAFARTLLSKPDWLFLDEATAALDDENQARLMALLRERLPTTTVVSIGHRPELEQFHDRQLVLVRDVEGARMERGSYIRQAAIRDFRRERQTRREKALRRFGDALAAARARDTYRWPGR